MFLQEFNGKVKEYFTKMHSLADEEGPVSICEMVVNVFRAIVSHLERSIQFDLSTDEPVGGNWIRNGMF